jgi:hypothetical protein
MTPGRKGERSKEPATPEGKDKAMDKASNSGVCGVSVNAERAFLDGLKLESCFENQMLTTDQMACHDFNPLELLRAMREQAKKHKISNDDHKKTLLDSSCIWDHERK